MGYSPAADEDRWGVSNVFVPQCPRRANSPLIQETGLMSRLSPCPTHSIFLAEACSQAAVIPSKEPLEAEGGAQGAFYMGKKEREIKHAHAHPHTLSSAYAVITAYSLNLQ